MDAARSRSWMATAVLNKIPVGRESQVAKAVLQYMPKPNLTGGTNNYVYDTTDSLAQTVYSIRIDQNLGPNHKVWGFFNSQRKHRPGQRAQSAAAHQLRGRRISNQLSKLSRGGWDWILTPRLINSLTVGSNRSNNYNKSRAANMGTDWDSKLGITNGSGPVFPGFDFVGSPFPSFGENNYAQDVDNTIALQRHDSLAARRAQLQIRRRSAVPPVLVHQQNRRHLQWNLGLLQLLG